MSKKIVLLVGIIFLLGLVGVVSAETLFTENFGTATFDKSRWVETGDTGAACDRWKASTAYRVGDSGNSAWLQYQYETFLAMANGLNTTNASEIVIDFSYMFKLISGSAGANHFWTIAFNDKDHPNTFTQYVKVQSTTGTLDAWYNQTVTLTEPKYMFDGFKVRFSGRGRVSGKNGDVYLDEITVSATFGQYTAATVPSPSDGSRYELTSKHLSWLAGNYSVSHDVYLGTNSDDVDNADNISALCVSPAQAGTIFDPELEYNTTYYWRIDENYDNGSQTGTLKGNVWSFTTMPSAGDVPSDPNFIGWWKFDDETGEMAWDYTGRANHGTITNATFVDGKLSKALNFVKANSCKVSIPAAAFSTLDKQVTVSMWAFGGDALPAENSVFEGINGTRRNLNSHLPWSSGSIYWHAGCDASVTDSISKAAAANLYKGQWNHYAFTKNTATGQMNMYINGKLWHSNTGKTKSMAGITSFSIGSVANGTASFYDGKVDDFRVYNREMNIFEVKQLAGNSAACNFSPANNAVTPLTVLLDWDSIATNPLYDVYFSSNFDDVNDFSPSAKIGGISESSYQVSDLNPDTTYYWAVDVNDNGNMFMAEAIMRFTTAKPYAQNPSPANGMMYIAPTRLSWTPSAIMTSQDIYLGTSPDALELVADDTMNSSYTPGTLTDGVTYYWQVDTTTSAGVNSLGIWSFTATVITDPNLVGWWKMDDTAAWDYSGYGHHGALMGTAAIIDDPCGVRGKVLVTDGNSAHTPYVKIDDFDYTNSSNECSLGFWFKTPGIVVSSQMPYMFNHGSGVEYASNNLDAYLRNSDDHGLITTRIILDGQGATAATRWQKTSPADKRYDDGQWHYYTVVLSATDAVYYVDGEVAFGPTTVPGIGNVLNPTQDILLGARDMIISGVPTIDRFFDGSLDDVRMYNKVLSQEDIWMLMGLEPDIVYMQQVMNNWLTTGPTGDLNSDGIVDLLDFNIMAGRWN